MANHTILLRPDGAGIPIDDSAAPMRDQLGNIIGVVLVFRDVSERRNADAAVAASAQRLSLALEAGRIGVWDWNEVHWVSTTAQVNRDSDGAPVRMLGATTDVTERKHAEDLVLRAHDDLQQFTYAAGHDLKEPLRMVTSYAQLIARRYRDVPSAGW